MRSEVIKIIVALFIVATIIIAGSFLAIQSGSQDSPDRVGEDELSDAAKASVPGAQVMKTRLAEEGYDDARVLINPDTGEVNVVIEPQDPNRVKGEMEQIALVYSEVVAENPEMGGLVVHVKGVAMVVPKDTALAYANGEINEEAFTETLVIEGNDTEQKD